MKNLDHLKEICDRNLGGLTADACLLQQIKLSQKPITRSLKWRPVLIGCAAVVVLAGAGLFALPRLLSGSGDISVVTRSAGGGSAEAGFALTASVPAGSVRISESAGQAPSYRTIFASGQGSGYPLIKLGDATYRLLTAPESLSGDLQGDQLGIVAEFTSEPAVSAAGNVSNVVAANEPVYAVRGMQGAAVAAVVNGKLRVFQRAAFGGVAVLGGETLRDVLLGSAQAVAMELTDVGVIDDPAQAEELMNVLLNNARYEGAAESANQSQSLLIWLSNGLNVQMNAGGGTLSACGTWSCPEFFSAFADAVSQ